MIKTLADALAKQGYETLTPVQIEVSDEQYDHADLLVSALHLQDATHVSTPGINGSDREGSICDNSTTSRAVAASGNSLAQ